MRVTDVPGCLRLSILNPLAQMDLSCCAAKAQFSTLLAAAIYYPALQRLQLCTCAEPEAVAMN